MKPSYIVVGLLLVAFLGIILIEYYREKEIPIALSEVPPIILDAAEKAVTGIVLSEAEIEKQGGRTVYELEGSAAGKDYEIEISETGEIIEIEEESEEAEEDPDSEESTAKSELTQESEVPTKE